MELCSLYPPMTTGMASRRQSRAMRVAHSHSHSHKVAHTSTSKEAAPSKVATLKVGPVKGMQGKGGKAASKVAHAEATPPPVRRSDIHSVQ